MIKLKKDSTSINLKNKNKKFFSFQINRRKIQYSIALKHGESGVQRQ